MKRMVSKVSTIPKKSKLQKGKSIMDEGNPSYRMFKTTKGGKYTYKDISEGKFKRVSKRLANKGGDVYKSDMTGEVMAAGKSGKGFKDKSVQKAYPSKYPLAAKRAPSKNRGTFKGGKID